MPEDSQRPVDHTDVSPKEEQKTLEQIGPKKYSRRDALQAMGKYSAYVGTSGLVIMSAQEAAGQGAVNASCFNQCIDNLPPRPPWLPPEFSYPRWWQILGCRRSCD